VTTNATPSPATPSRIESFRPYVSATIPVGISKRKNASSSAVPASTSSSGLKPSSRTKKIGATVQPSANANASTPMYPSQTRWASRRRIRASPYPDRFSFPCFFACVSPSRKIQSPTGAATTPITSKGQISSHIVPTPAPSRIASRIPSST
jgi:hypothetical protein